MRNTPSAYLTLHLNDSWHPYTLQLAPVDVLIDAPLRFLVGEASRSAEGPSPLLYSKIEGCGGC